MLTVKNESDFQVDDGLFVVKFWAAWCVPCKRMEPYLTKLEQEFCDSLKFVSIEAEQVPSLTKKYHIKTLPTVLLFKNGQEINRLLGSVLIEPMRKAFRDLSKNDG